MADEVKLQDLLSDALAVREQGETPNLEDLCRNSPELLEPLAEKLRMWDAFDDLRGCSSDPEDMTTPPTQSDSDPNSLDVLMAHSDLRDYKLVARVGQGSCGDVWKAHDSNGYLIALKFVGLHGTAGQRELQSLETLKNLKHLHLLTIFRYWLIGDRLVIAMELADGTLRDRLEEYREMGRNGIPIDELLGYMRDCASSIDYLNMLGLQHSDIKSTNIMLVGGRVKVGDFGLISLLEQGDAFQRGTKVYAPPELALGKRFMTSDQYSLAVTYVYLRTGHLPFSIHQCRSPKEHVERKPNLQELTEIERPIVARALATAHDNRWPDCGSFVEALATAPGALAHRATAWRTKTARTKSSSPIRRLMEPRVSLKLLITFSVLTTLSVMIDWWATSLDHVRSVATATQSEDRSLQSIPQKENVTTRRRIAVIGFQNDEHGYLSSKSFAEKITAQLIYELKDRRGYDVADRETVSAAIVELKITTSINLGSAKIRSLGNLLQVDYVVLGSYREFQPGMYRLDIRLVDASTVMNLVALGDECTEEDVDPTLKKLAQTLKDKHAERFDLENTIRSSSGTLAAQARLDGMPLHLFVPGIENRSYWIEFLHREDARIKSLAADDQRRTDR